MDQAAQVNSWDRLLMENGEKVQMNDPLFSFFLSVFLFYPVLSHLLKTTCAYMYNFMLCGLHLF